MVSPEINKKREGEREEKGSLNLQFNFALTLFSAPFCPPLSIFTLPLLFLIFLPACYFSKLSISFTLSSAGLLPVYSFCLSHFPLPLKAFCLSFMSKHAAELQMCVRVCVCVPTLNQGSSSHLLEPVSFTYSQSH